MPTATLKKIKKKLRFDNLVRVTLIPSITEYKDAGLHLVLWCSQNELQCYKDSAYIEIKQFMQESSCMNFSEAMKSLFQVEKMAECSDCGGSQQQQQQQLKLEKASLYPSCDSGTPLGSPSSEKKSNENFATPQIAIIAAGGGVCHI